MFSLCALPSQTKSCWIHVERACSTGGSRCMTWLRMRSSKLIVGMSGRVARAISRTSSSTLPRLTFSGSSVVLPEVPTLRSTANEWIHTFTASWRRAVSAVWTRSLSLATHSSKLLMDSRLKRSI